jgi:hypothetical protein
MKLELALTHEGDLRATFGRKYLDLIESYITQSSKYGFNIRVRHT